jgi:hypothetical protein
MAIWPFGKKQAREQSAFEFKRTEAGRGAFFQLQCKYGDADIEVGKRSSRPRPARPHSSFTPRLYPAARAVDSDANPASGKTRMATRRNSMKTIIGFAAATVTAAMTIVLPAPPAAAQSMNLITQPRALTEKEKQTRAEQEKAYNEQLGKIPDQKANNDPWGKVRSAGTPPPPGTPKAKKNQQQTGSK